MSCQILAFPTDRIHRSDAAAPVRRNNIISLAAWRSKARPRRTLHGVFFTSEVLAFSGGVA